MSAVALSTLDRQSIYIYQSAAGTAVTAASITNIWLYGTPIAVSNSTGTPEITFGSSRINFSNTGNRTVEVLFTGGVSGSTTTGQSVAFSIYRTGVLVASALTFTTGTANVSNTVLLQWVGTVTSSDYINVYFQNTTASPTTVYVQQGSAVIARFIN